MVVQTPEDDYKEMALLRQWEDKLKQQSTVNNQNTEDDFKILLTILSIINHYHYFPHPPTWSGNLCLGDTWHNQNTLPNKLSGYSEIYFISWMKHV